MRPSKPVLAIIVPCYNEVEILRTTIEQLDAVIKNLITDELLHEKSFIFLIDDGSSDGTWNVIETMHRVYPSLKAIKLSRNFGQQNAILAGLLTGYRYAECYLSIDADLQDDITIIKEMLMAYQSGAEIVYGVRKNRQTDSFFKRWTAGIFYYVMQILGVETIVNHADYRLVSQKIIQELAHYPECHLFLRGIFPTLGFQTASVYYDRLERKAGYSKYPFKKMLAFAWEGIASFSIKPLRCIVLVGGMIFLTSLVLAGYAIYSYLALDVVPGWTSIVLPLYLLGGIQLLSIGLIGEYLGKVYQEVKRRPRFIIDRFIGE